MVVLTEADYEEMADLESQKEMKFVVTSATERYGHMSAGEGIWV